MRISFIACVALFLASCQATGVVPSGIGSSSTPYDGKWAGTIKLKSGRYCGDYIKTNGAIRFDVTNGLLSKYFDDMVYSALNVGYITQNGEFYGKLRAEQAGRYATSIYKGTASSGALTGKWLMPASGCEGEFNLTRQSAVPEKSMSTQQRLIDLKKLVDSNLITNEEAAVKRKEILDGM